MLSSPSPSAHTAARYHELLAGARAALALLPDEIVWLCGMLAAYPLPTVADITNLHHHVHGAGAWHTPPGIVVDVAVLADYLRARSLLERVALVDACEQILAGDPQQSLRARVDASGLVTPFAAALRQGGAAGAAAQAALLDTLRPDLGVL